MDYTIIGAEVNLAARLESICEPDRIIVSSHTYHLVKDDIAATPLPPIHVKGISQPITPYRVDGLVNDVEGGADFLHTESRDMRLFIDLRRLTPERREAIARELQEKASLVKASYPDFGSTPSAG